MSEEKAVEELEELETDTKLESFVNRTRDIELASSLTTPARRCRGPV